MRARARARRGEASVRVRCPCARRACGRDVCARADRGLVRGICPGLVGLRVGLAHIDRDSFRGNYSGLMERTVCHGA